jgi:hypothetical protein
VIGRSSLVSVAAAAGEARTEARFARLLTAPPATRGLTADRAVAPRARAVGVDGSLGEDETDDEVEDEETTLCCERSGRGVGEVVVAIMMVK